jgi:hypothetical protein
MHADECDLPGNKNALKNGRYTREALAQQQKDRELLRAIRLLLDESDMMKMNRPNCHPARDGCVPMGCSYCSGLLGPGLRVRPG